MENVKIDTLILNLFESQSDKVCFPVISQVECKRFVKWLHEDGLTYDILCNEMGECEGDFSLWRRGMTKKKIGEKVIKRINKPIDDFLETADSVEDDSYEAVFEKQDNLGKKRRFESISYKLVPENIRNMVPLIEEMNTDEDITMASIDKVHCEECVKKVKNKETKFEKICDKFLENTVESLVNNSINIAINKVSELTKKTAHKKLSSDSFTSCSSILLDHQDLLGRGDTFVSEESYDIKEVEPSIQETSQFTDTAAYNQISTLDFATNLENYFLSIYVFSQQLKNKSRFKIGATSDLESVKKQVSEYNLDLTLVDSYKVKNIASFGGVLHSLQNFKINPSNWFEAEYSEFMQCFNEAIKNCL